MRTALVSAPWTSGLPGLVNALSHPSTGSPFPSIQAAYDYVKALPRKGQLYIPAGGYGALSTPAYAGLRMDSENVRVFGDGDGVTTLDMDGQDPDLDNVAVTASYASIEDLTIEGQAENGAGVGLRIGPGGDPQRHVWGRNLTISNSPSRGLHMTGAAGNIVILSGLDHCRILNPHTYGAAYFGPGCVSNTLRDVNMPVNPDSGPIVMVDGAYLTRIVGGSLEPAGDAVCLQWDAAGDPAVMGLEVSGVYIELHDPTGAASIFDFSGTTGQLIGADVHRNIIKRYPEGTNRPVRLARLRGVAQPFRNIRFESNWIYENRTGAVPTGANADVQIENNSHEFMAVHNVTWSRTGALTRALTYNGSTAAVLDWDYKHFMFPRISTESGYTSGLLQGAAWRHITLGRSRQFTGAASETIQAVPEAEE